MKIHIHLQGDDFNYEDDIDLSVAGRIIEFLGEETERKQKGLLPKTYIPHD